MMISVIFNVILLAAFLLDRVLRLKAIREYKDAKEAQLDYLKQQYNDVELTELYRKRYESLKVLFQEREHENDEQRAATKQLRALVETLLTDLNRLERARHTWEIEKKVLQVNR